MNEKELNLLNIDNLTRLWKVMGFKEHQITESTTLKMSTDWPHRVWFDDQLANQSVSQLTNSTNFLNESLFSSVLKDKTIPVWHAENNYLGSFEKKLISNGFQESFTQLAMVLPLNESINLKPTHAKIYRVNSETAIQAWTQVASKAFNYSIDIGVIKKIATHSDIRLLLAVVNEQPAATAMTYQTEQVLGIHQVGVLKEYRQQGLANELMHFIIKEYSGQSRWMTLQASELGKGLYKKLGFQQQFLIKNYAVQSHN